MKVLDLFSGIGGFSLGLERTGGFETVAFCEIDPFCRRVLAKHWPRVRQYDDVRLLTADRLRADDISVDVICGGFPCQDISHAGKGAGIDGERSGLWSEYARLIGELRPRYVLVENVAALLGRGLERVLGDLAALGFDAEWHCIPASAVGAPHRRDRLWLVAYPNGERQQQPQGSEPEEWGWSVDRRADVADAEGIGRGEGWARRPDRLGEELRQRPLPDAYSFAPLGAAISRDQRRDWLPEPDVGRVATRVPNRVDRLRALGNAVVPQIPELIGRAILAD